MNLHHAARRQNLSSAIRKMLKSRFVTVGALLALTAAVTVATLDVKLSSGLFMTFFVPSTVLIFVGKALRNSAWRFVSLGAFAGLQGLILGPLLRALSGLTIKRTAELAGAAVRTYLMVIQWK